MISRQSCSISGAHPAEILAQKMPVPVDGKQICGVFGFHPDGGMGRLARRPDPTRGSRKVYVAQLLGPHIVFRHVGESAKRSQTARGTDSPARFLDHLAMQGVQRRFTRVDPPTRKLKLRARLRLPGDQYLPTLDQYGIGSGAQPVVLLRIYRLAEPPYHGLPLGAQVAPPI